MVKNPLDGRENLSISENGHLCMGEHDLVDLADRFGTPLYVVDAQRIREKYRRFREAFSFYPRVLIAYAYKANSNLAVCSILKKEGAGADVVSGGELFIALSIGVDPEKIVFDGVSKSEAELNMAIENEIGAINVESLQELRKIESIAARLSRKARIGIRLNPDVPVETHPHDVTGVKSSKFGLDFEEALKTYKEAIKMKHVDVKGIHMHIGSQITEVAPFKNAVLRLFELVSKLKEMKVILDYIDLGGGLGIFYKDSKKDCIKEYASTLLNVLKRRIDELELGEPKLVFEPGRYLVADSSILLTRVNYVKKIFGRRWALVDAGMNDFMRPAFYGAYHEIVAANKASQPRSKRYDVGGPICESSDVFRREVELPEISQGDLLAILDVGAYGISMSNQYNMRPRPPMVLLDGLKVGIIRKGEKYEDLVSNDRIPDWIDP